MSNGPTKSVRKTYFSESLIGLSVQGLFWAAVFLLVIVPLALALIGAYLWITLGTFGYGMQFLLHTPGSGMKFLSCLAVTIVAPFVISPLAVMLKRLSLFKGQIASIMGDSLGSTSWSEDSARQTKALLEAQNAKGILESFESSKARPPFT